MTAGLGLRPLANVYECRAERAWQRIEFISDLHLSDATPATFEAWALYLRTTPADAVFILGDLFEVWVGDDALDAPADRAEPAFWRRCAALLQAHSQRTVCNESQPPCPTLPLAPTGDKRLTHIH